MLNVLFQPITFGARYLQHRRATWVHEQVSIEQVESGSAAACEQDDGLVAAPPRFRGRCSLRSNRFSHPNLSVTAQRAELAANPLGAGKGGIK
jgi:hypothetical protein